MSIRIDLSEITGNLAAELQLDEEFAKDVADKMALDLHGDLVLNTAVDTGTLRAGWTVDTSGASPVIENNVEYAMVIMEDGHSKQTPAGTLTNLIDKHTRF